jgi:benzil reductase ((S)-benzoin forming)
MSISSDFILITGASRGLGKELAMQMAKPGATMVLFARDMASLKEVEEACRLKGAIVNGVKADLSKNTFVKLFRTSIKVAKPAHIDRLFLFNNASIIEPIRRLIKLTKVSQKKLLAVNLEAPFWLCSEFLRFSKNIKPRESYIINISSGVSLKPIEGWSLYCTSKAGINMLTACIHEETKYWKNVVYAVSVNPGALDTKMQALIRDSDVNESSIGDKFRDMHQNNLLKHPSKAALEILNLLIERPFPNGQFIDMNLRQT